MEGQKVPVKGRKLGSTRKIRRPLRDAEEAKPQREEEEDVTAKVQEFFQACDGDKKGFITRSDMQKVTGNFLCSSEELELLFDGLDTDRNGYITTEELTAGIRTFVESQNAIKQQRRKRPSSKRVSVAPEFPSLEEADSEERQQFLYFMEQLGANNIFEDESEIWKLWTKLRHDEPFLLGNLEEFLAKVMNELKEARKEKEALELTLKKRIADHNEEVKQLYEEMEEQLYQERERLQNESDFRSNIQSKEMKKVLDIKDNEVQHLVFVQNELESQLHGLRGKQLVTSTENAQLKRTNQDLAEQLEGIRGQLLEAQQRLLEMRKDVSPEPQEEKRSQNLSKESVEASVPQEMTQQDKSSLDEALSLELEPKQNIDPVLNTAVSDTILQTIPPNLSEVVDIKSAPRIRVISIEEDPLPEFMNEDYMDLQNTLSHPKILQMESLAEEADMTEMDGPLMTATMSGHPISGTEQSIRLTNISEPAKEISNQNASEEGVVQNDTLAVSKQEVLQGHASKEEPSMMDFLISHKEQFVMPEKETPKRNILEANPEANTLEHRAPEASTATNNFGRRRGLEDDLLEREERREASLKSNKVEEASEQEEQDEKAGDHLTMRLEDALEEVDPEQDHRPGSRLQEAEELHKTEKLGDDEAVKTDSLAKVKQNPDHVYKVLFVGNSNVGKTSFLNQVHDGLYCKDMTATIGLDYRIKTFTVDDKSFALQLWDTAGQERYHSITKQFFRKADGVVVMYDVTSRLTFMDVRYWMDCIQEKAGDEVLTLLLGNKIDCESERQVSTNEGKQLAEDHNLLFFECSAAAGLNISEAITGFARSLKAHEDILKHKVVNLRPENKKKSSCCM